MIEEFFAVGATLNFQRENMNTLHRVANLKPSLASSAASVIAQQKGLALAGLAFLFPLGIISPAGTAEHLFSIVRYLFSV